MCGTVYYCSYMLSMLNGIYYICDFIGINF